MMNSKGCVILLHGLARTYRSMHKMAHHLRAAGYEVVNYNYPSTKFAVEHLAKQIIDKALAQCPRNTRIHFVTHSMGGILLRQYLRNQTIDNLGHVVMLGPPNQGSEVVDTLKNIPGYALINGPAGQQLGTDAMSIPKTLGPAQFSLGIIAGTRSINLFLSAMIKGRNDGKVSVENSKLHGMADHIALPVTHPMMMRNNTVINQVLHFLQHGIFDHSRLK